MIRPNLPVSGLLAPALPGHCDFEADLCGYSQDKQGDDADWERRRGPTPTSYTGPRGDHTMGLGEGRPAPILVHQKNIILPSRAEKNKPKPFASPYAG